MFLNFYKNIEKNIHKKHKTNSEYKQQKLTIVTTGKY